MRRFSFTASKIKSKREKLIITCKGLHLIGVLVQLVRIRACHARGHGFESHTYRNFKNVIHQPS